MTATLRRAARRVLDIIGRKEIEPALLLAAPSPQNALDVFKDEWISGAPPSVPGLVAGRLPLFNDERLAWAVDALGGVRDQRVLELGPMEGAHSYMLLERGARHVLSIEGNQRCFLKCLVMKEVAGMPGVHFVLGNFMEYLRTTQERFDLCLAAGVLYHMAQPVELIHLMSRVADRAYIWTHYYDASRVGKTISAPHFRGAHQLSYGTFSCTAQRYEYFATSRRARYAGGLQTHSHWLSRDDLLRCLAHVGYSKVEVAFDEPGHVHGPCLSLAASRA